MHAMDYPMYGDSESSSSASGGKGMNMAEMIADPDGDSSSLIVLRLHPPHLLHSLNNFPLPWR